MADSKCNELIQRDIEISNCQETNPVDCHRTFYFVLPNILCQSQPREQDDESRDSDTGDGRDDREGSVADGNGGGLRHLEENGLGDDNSDYSGAHSSSSELLLSDPLKNNYYVGTLPLVFAIHCYGCNARTMASFIPYANSHNLVLVLPEGIQSSFNAVDCCGYALEKNIDDVQFLSQIQGAMSDEFSFIQSTVSYAVGWSNGGFMVTYAASLFRAISPISGYISNIDYSQLTTKYDDRDSAGGDGGGGKGIFLHHSLDDRLVQSTGCCQDPTLPRCCCNIAAQTCVNVVQILNDWAYGVNLCDVDEEVGERGDTTTKGMDATPYVVQTGVSYNNEERGITCMTATGNNCKANATLCIHEKSGHFNNPSFEKAFPMAKQVMDFFAKDACQMYDSGVWNENNNECTCDEYSKYGGTFCIDLIDGSKINNAGKEVYPPIAIAEASEKHTLIIPSLLIIIISMYALFRKWQRPKRRNSRRDEVEIEETHELVAPTKGLGRL